jgi:hypothetical protein
MYLLRMAQGLSPKYDAVEKGTLDVRDSIDALGQEAQQLKFLSFKGPEKFKKARGIQGDVEALKKQIKVINEELEDMGDGKSLESEVYAAFTKLNNRSVEVNTLISNIERKLLRVKQQISDNNLWAALYDVFDEIAKVLSDTAMKIVKISKIVAIKAAQDAVKRLPPSRSKQLAESLSSVFSNVAGFLTGR